jgi:hypothetical protein
VQLKILRHLVPIFPAVTISRHTGALLIVSHLNAHVPSGRQWLNDVIVPGLQTASKGADASKSPICAWEIEVHGNSGEESLDAGGVTSGGATGDDELEEENAGPAVYIIHKLAPLTSKTTTVTASSSSPSLPPKPIDNVNCETDLETGETDDEPSIIPVRFFTY